MRSGKNDLYEDLKNQILTMELDPDQVLDELGLSERYGLSRTPVREVFRRLAGEGYLDIQENRGARVAPMNHSTLRNFFLVAPMVYAAIGRLAVHNYKPGQLRDLRATQSASAAPVPSTTPAAWWWPTTASTKSWARCRATLTWNPASVAC
jgi:DNA-binding GntR family transcriptional regulator